MAVFWTTNAGRGTTVHDGSYQQLQREGPYQSRLTLSFDDRWTVLWSSGHLAGAILLVVGLLVLAATGGWWLGRRRTGRRRTGRLTSVSSHGVSSCRRGGPASQRRRFPAGTGTHGLGPDLRPSPIVTHCVNRV